MTHGTGTPPAYRTAKRPGRRVLPGRFAYLFATCLFALAGPALAAASEVRIGLAAPFTGRMAPVGHAIQKALEAAIAEANAEDGLSGSPLALVVADDGCAGATAEGSAATLIAERVAVVLGHPCSGAATRAAARYGEAGLLLVAVGARHPDVTDANPGAPVLRLAGRDDRQGEAAARWLIAHARERRIAIVHDRTSYARAIADRAKAALESAGVTALTVLPIAAGNRDYATAVGAIAEARAEALLFAGFVEEAAILVAGLAEQGLTMPVLGTDSLATAAFADLAARSPAPVQILLPALPRPRATDSGGNDETGETHALAAQARAAFEAWLTTARRIGTTETRAMHRALRDTPAETQTLGPLRFDEKGDLVGEDFVPATAGTGPGNAPWVRTR